ncbi:pteridine reductase [Legionella spiritensis]|uniref:Pteridine reductase n=1 Tax=Legionella spiritensis TaxID=452 RepID=A0A0W0ZBM4_LEGSP|nr:pteridine reductase [Legionella spiritensis]KTD66275.1 pteridine reductase [Legionella spiritensis]SNV48431.1 pteridine reductase 1 [Legionella spiritensis]
MNQNNKQAIPVALVTGSARRIGAAIVQILHKSGYKVVIHCHHSHTQADKLAQLLNDLRADSALVIRQDLNQPDVGERLIHDVINRTGRLDLLVNNASLFRRTELHQWDARDHQELFAVNVLAPLALSMAAFPFLSQQRGCIVNITDIHAVKPLKGYASYCQTKAALAMQTRALARELAPTVRVNAVAPGAILWPEHENALNQDIREHIIAGTPLKSHGQPDYIAQAVLALIDNPFITGQILNVDGGRSVC